MTSQDVSLKSLLIEKLTSENYHLWKFKMRMLLRERDLWDVVEEGLDGEEYDGMKEKEKKEWKKRDDKALAVICLALSDAQLMHVQTVLTAKEAWLKLSEVHERRGLANKLYLRRQFLNMRMSDSDGMLEHINKVKTMAQRLAAIDTPLQLAREL